MGGIVKQLIRLALSAIAAFLGGTLLGVIFQPLFPIVAVFSLLGVFGAGPVLAILLWALKKYKIEHFILCGIVSAFLSVIIFIVISIFQSEDSISFDYLVSYNSILLTFPVYMVCMVFGAIGGIFSYLAWFGSRDYLLGTSLTVILVAALTAVRVFDEVSELLFI